MRKGRVGKDTFNSIDVAWTEPFWLLHERWFNKAWKEDKKNPGSGRGGGTIKINMREPSFLKVINSSIRVHNTLKELEQTLA